MAKPFKPKIVSANDLLVGDVVYLDAQHKWTRVLDEAVRADSKEEADALLARADQPSRVVDAQLIDVDETGRPSTFRERIRERGPTVRPDLGRQAERAIHYGENTEESASHV